jgi:5-phospho-D-xylono-1,4-lactonase
MPAADGPGARRLARTPSPEPVEGPASPQPARAAVVKAGIGYWSITTFEHRVLAAVAAAWHRTGAPLMVHLEDGSAAFEVLAELSAAGVPASAVALAHVDRNPDPGLHAELAAAGAYLGYDGFARSQRWPDSVLLDCLLRAAELGAGPRLLLGGDVARATRYRGYGGMPGLAYLGERVLPRLRAAAPPGLVDAALTTNPARWLTGGSDE